MPTFIYKANDQNGKLIEGEAVAGKKEDVIDALVQKKLIPITIELKGAKKGPLLGRGVYPPFFSKVTTLDKFQIVSRLSALIKAGIGIGEAFNIMIDGAEKPAVKKILSQAKIGLEKGQQLSSIFAEHKKYFSPLFIGLIRAGETSGNLDAVLDQLATSFKKDYEMARKIRSASFYPIILMVAAVIIVSVLVFFVMPRVFSAFEQSGLELPLITKILISTSNFLKNNFLLIFILIIILIILLALLKKTQSGEILILKISDRLPIIGSLSRKVALAKFSGNLSMLLASGMPLTEVLDIISDAVGNKIYKIEILEIQTIVKKGIPLSDALKNYPRHFPSLLTGTMKAGEQSGKLEDMLRTMSTFYAEEVDSAVGSLVSTIEPVLLLFMGFVIGTVSLAILLPMYKLIGSF